MEFSNKKTVLVAALLLACNCIKLKAQTSAEIFQQKKTQKKYLIAQITALKMFTDYAAKGYKIVSSGLNLITKIKGADNELHLDFFSSMQFVSPAIAKVARLTEMQAALDRTRKMIDRTNHEMHGKISARREKYVRLVFDEVLDRFRKNMETLLALCSDATLTLTEAQRIARMQAVQEVITADEMFVNRFATSVTAVIQIKESQTAEITLQHLNQHE
jgi:hypothetical protein